MKKLVEMIEKLNKKYKFSEEELTALEDLINELANSLGEEVSMVEENAVPDENAMPEETEPE